jgi:hypothetical protein
MGIPVLIYGKSGAGKSRSLKGFKDDEIYLVNVLGKPLPFKGAFKYVTTSDQLQTIMAGLASMEKQGIKTAVVDDFGYIMTNMFMRSHGSGDQFKLYNQIGDTVWTFINYIQSSAVAPDAIVYLIMHEDLNDDGTTKLRTIGKLLDQKVCIEGMVTVCLHAAIKGDRYVFETQSNGATIAKSPEGMFPEPEIANDLKLVDDAIRSYWGLGAPKKGGK